jgi:hypothetical protein
LGENEKMMAKKCKGVFSIQALSYVNAIQQPVEHSVCLALDPLNRSACGQGLLTYWPVPGDYVQQQIEVKLVVCPSLFNGWV